MKQTIILNIYKYNTNNVTKFMIKPVNIFKSFYKRHIVALVHSIVWDTPID